MANSEYIEVLAWAAGAGADAPAAPDIDMTELCQLLIEHRLTQRFCLRLEREHSRRRHTSKNFRYGHAPSATPAWCSPELVSFLRRRCAEEESQGKRQLAALKQIACAMTAAGHPLITIKGLSVYALTSDPHHRRYSSDLDLLSDDPVHLWKTLLQLGYDGQREEGKHEFAIMTRDGVVVEIHRHFPVWAYPEGWEIQDFTPSHHPGVWHHAPSSPVERRICYADLRRHAVTGTAHGMRGLQFPSLTMQCLIMCTHIFRSYLYPPLKTPVEARLSVLADIRDLFRHPAFSERQFHALVDRFCGADAVAFAYHLLETAFGSCPPQAGGPSGEPRATFPRRIMQNSSLSFGWYLPKASNLQFLAQGMDSFVQELGANRVGATAGQAPPRWYSTRADKDCELLPRLIVQTGPLPRPHLDVAVAWDEDAISFSVRLQGPLSEGTCYFFNVHGERDHRLWVKLSVFRGDIDFSSNLTTALIHFSEKERLLRLACPWSWLPAAARYQPCVRLAIEIKKWYRGLDPLACSEPAVMLLPLEVHSPPEGNN